MSMFEDVKAFHKFFGHAIARQPTFMTEERAKNRMKWQDEERQEFLDALEVKDIAEAADAIVDQLYFILGTAVEMGIPVDHVWDLVHSANMAKAMKSEHHPHCPLNIDWSVPTKCTCGAVKYKEDGKTAKPEDWTAPDDKIRFLLVR